MSSTGKSYKVAAISPYASVDGIAEYTKDMYHGADFEVAFLANKDILRDLEPTNPDLYRIWELGIRDMKPIIDWIHKYHPHVVHIQHHPGFYNLKALEELIVNIPGHIRIFITPHVVKGLGIDIGRIVSRLKIAEKIYVHKLSDVEHLKNLGLNNVVHFPLPTPTLPRKPKQTIKQRLQLTQFNPVIATHGLISKHKNLDLVAAAVAELKVEYPNVIWLALNAVNQNNRDSKTTYENLVKLVEDLKIEDNVIFFPQFLSLETVITILQAVDVGVLAYTEMGESASASIKKFFSAGTMCVVPDIDWMQEFDLEVAKFSEYTAKAIAEKITEVYSNPDLLQSRSKSAYDNAQKYNWESRARLIFKDYDLSSLSNSAAHELSQE